MIASLPTEATRARFQTRPSNASPRQCNCPDRPGKFSPGLAELRPLAKPWLNTVPKGYSLAPRMSGRVHSTAPT